jgi:hypothetical protein
MEIGESKKIREVEPVQVPIPGEVPESLPDPVEEPVGRSQS